MTMALLFTGFLRNKEDTKSSFERNLILPYDAKVFVATWDVPDIGRPPLGGDEEVRAPGEVTGSSIYSFFGDRLADCCVFNYEIFRKTTPLIKARNRPFDLLEINPRARDHNVVWMNRLFSQWYLVRQGLRMIEEYQLRTGEKFDIVCRTRTDISILDAPPAPTPGKLFIPANYPTSAHVSNFNIPSSMFADYFYFGSPDVMMKLSDLCYDIEKMYDRQYTDCTNAEHLFYSYIVRKDIPVETLFLNYTRV